MTSILVRTVRWTTVTVSTTMLALATTQATAEEAKSVHLFNGKDLAGWEIQHGGVYSGDGEMLVLDKGNGWLKSERAYDDFELTVEWRADAEYADPNVQYDSGLFIRAPAEGKPWPRKKYQVGMAEGKEGGITGLTKQNFPQLINPPGEWNTYHVLAIGNDVTVHINGKFAFKSDQATVRRGFFGLQAEGYRFEFRRIDVKELGFRNAFNGKDLTDWVAEGDASKWRVSGEKLSCLGGGGWLHTRREIRNAVLSLEFNVPPGGNSGVFLRALPTGNPAYTGMEIQILDDDTDVFGKLKPTQMTGSLYGSYAPSRRAFSKAGEWQHLLIYCVDDQVMVWLNGQLVVSADISKDAGLAKRAKRGFFGLQDYGKPMEFRNVRLKTLDDPAP